jgi:hypothetical protein
MPNSNGVTDTSILESALIGLQHQQGEIQAKISDLRRALGIREPRESSAAGLTPRRKMSRSGRERIAAAQKKRWAAYKTVVPVQKQSSAAAPNKRRLSAAARRRIAEATRKRWAAYRAQKAAGSKLAATKKAASKKVASRAA